MDVKKKIRIEIYDYTITLIVTDNVCKTRNKYSKKLGGDIAENEFVDGCFCSNGYNDFSPYIFLEYNATSSTIAHESLHAVCHLMRMIGGDLSSESEESYAYMLGYIVDEISKVYIKISKEIIN